jgi:uncharacterized membrane protein YdbT with pleckstrin-like domain
VGYLESILGKDERVVFATRRHWFTIAGTVLVSAILSIIIIAGAILPVSLHSRIGSLSLLLLLLLIVPLGRLLSKYLDWWNEQFIVTNRRIIQIEGVFNKHVIDSSLEKVNDIIMDQTMMGRLLGYGNIEILTASDISVNKLDNIANPIRFKTTMLDQKELMSDEDEVHGHAPDHAMPKTMPDLIAELAALRDRGVISEAEFQSKKNEMLSRM